MSRSNHEQLNRNVSKCGPGIQTVTLQIAEDHSYIASETESAYMLTAGRKTDCTVGSRYLAETKTNHL